jgi:hypothetical protein
MGHASFFRELKWLQIDKLEIFRQDYRSLRKKELVAAESGLPDFS